MRCCLLCHMRLPWEGAIDCLIACSTGVQDMNLFMDSNDLYDLFPGNWTSNLSIYCITGLKPQTPATAEVCDCSVHHSDARA